MDFYGGYKGTITDGLGYDVGLLQYYYPQKNRPTRATRATCATPGRRSMRAAVS